MNDDASAAHHEVSPLAYLAGAESDATNPIHIDLTIARVVESIAVIGAGTMGSGIAICALDAGLQVTLVEQVALRWALLPLRTCRDSTSRDGCA